ncbi:MAG: 30S ribosomal protein S17 [Proteobacteria bacterium]|nr:30S ribosomal protein S17 [Pseudomonadota bacterium]
MKERGTKKRMVGTVVSDRMDKTVVVLIERTIQHSVYKKFVRRRARYAAHDETNDCKVGDRVAIIESRPLSKTKRWRVAQVLARAV